VAGGKGMGAVLERKALLVSVIGGGVLGAVGIAVGLIGGSPTILFDGFYTFLGVGLSWMAMKVARLVASGPTRKYPFGREALTPLIIGVEGVALLATCAYATFNAVVLLSHGGSKIPSLLDAGYAIAALVIPVGIWLWLRRGSSTSELVSAESLAWLSGSILGAGMVVAFFGARALSESRWAAAAPYVDPSLVIAAGLSFVGPPIRMIRRTLVELVEGVPGGELEATVREAVGTVSAAFNLGEYSLRMTKIGRKFYVEIECVVERSWTVAQSDQVRQALGEQLSLVGYELWLTVEFTAMALEG
jgi:predicted Co/Zn/Cd cation transporter (cation efflux family)